jgi:hypothetical protein
LLLAVEESLARKFIRKLQIFQGVTELT